MKKNNSEMSDLVELPREIIEQNILPRLPLNSILRFRCVSKSLCELFRNPCFIRNHQFLQSNNNNPKLMLINIPRTNHCLHGGTVYSLDFGKKYHPHNVVEIPHSHIQFQFRIIWGSSHGLVCVKNVDFMYLWNPSTREHKLVPYGPDSPLPHTNGVDRYRAMIGTTYGFGYNGIAKDFEIIKINSYFNYDRNFSSCFSIYSLRNNSWEAYKDMAPYLVETTTKGVLVNDALHWVGYKSKSVIAFDLGDRKFRELPITIHDEHEHPHLRAINTVSLNGCLSVAVVCNHGIEAWMMKDYGVKESWTKVIKVIAPYLTYSTDTVLDCFAMNIATQRMDFHDVRTYTLDEFLEKLGGGYHNVKEVIAQSYTSTIYTETLVSLQGYND